MKQLTIKELSAYLPYELNVLHTTFIEFGKNRVFIDTLESLHEDCATFKSSMDYYFTDPQENECEIKLILRPLSDLTKKEFRIKLKELGYRTDEDGISDIISDIQLMYANYEIMVFCFENHIDVFNLIPQNLAIDINTI